MPASNTYFFERLNILSQKHFGMKVQEDEDVYTGDGVIYASSPYFAFHELCHAATCPDSMKDLQNWGLNDQSYERSPIDIDDHPYFNMDEVYEQMYGSNNGALYYEAFSLEIEKYITLEAGKLYSFSKEEIELFWKRLVMISPDGFFFEEFINHEAPAWITKYCNKSKKQHKAFLKELVHLYGEYISFVLSEDYV